MSLNDKSPNTLPKDDGTNVTGCSRILYATQILPTDDIGRRVPRQRQSAAASRLLEQLGGPRFLTVAQSRSHSRAAVAVTACDAVGSSLGIDIEWMAPDRPFDAIAHAFLTSAPQQIGIGDFYRGWTFFEAYYKAFQRFPEGALVKTVVRRAFAGTPHSLGDGSWAMLRRVSDLFQLCLVWRTSEFCVPTHVASADGAGG